MAKQQVPPRYILKLHSDRLKKSKWNLSITLSDARKNDELVSLGDSMMLRWIDELNGIEDRTAAVEEIRAQIKSIRSESDSIQARHAARALYAKLDESQFVPDFMYLVIDHNKDLFRACKGFEVNGVRYVRLLGTNGGVKMSTIVFVSERLAPTLRARIDNGRDESVPQIPAKLEAYRALTCSGSIPVSMPHGILVVPDCETTFHEDVIMLSDEESDEPTMSVVRDMEIRHDESDGYGMMLPSLAARWSAEIGLDYVTSGANTRASWEKGVVFTFDFIDFADKVAGGQYIVKDAWGDEVDIRNVELVLTTSMLKLWACYPSLDAYLRNCEANHYTFGIAKTCPKELDRRRDLNLT